MSDRRIQALVRGVAAAALVATFSSPALPDAPGPAAAAAQGARPHHPPPGASSGSFFEDLFKVYTPRKECMFHETPVVWLHLVSDLLIGLAYFSIPVALIYFVRRRRDLAFHRIFWMFAAFILACGSTHLVGVWDLWQPMYRIDGLVKAATAAISVTTAIVLWPLIPKALALPSPAQLEQRVGERTIELARANEALLAARGEAERANRMKDEFLATLSHELRTPLQAVLGWSAILRVSNSPEQVAEGIEVITRNAQAQGRLIDDLLDMSRITSGHFRLDVQAMNLAETVRAVVASVQPAADAREIRLQAIVDSRVGSIMGDPTRLQQVVWNLLSNAVKFTPARGHIEVVLERTDSHVELRVTDDGEGIEPESLTHLFRRFYQADAHRRHGGLGIGLALVRHIVELHGGTVQASSEGKGRGTRFVVVLPVHASAQEPGTGGARSHDFPSPILRGLRVLAIEDDADTRRLIETILRNAGATVSTAGEAAEGLERLREERPDVLLCDLGLPGADGLALIRRVRELGAGEGGLTPAVAVTAFARPEDRGQALLAGFQVHLAKPFDASELVATIAGLAGLPLQPRGGHTP